MKDTRDLLGCNWWCTAALEEFQTACSSVISGLLWLEGFCWWWGWLSLVALKVIFSFSGSNYPRAVTSRIRWLPRVSSSSSLYLTERQYWVSCAVAGLTRVKKKYVSRHLDPCIYTSYRDIRCNPSRACGKIKYQKGTCYQEHISSWVSKADTGSDLFKHTFLVCQHQWGAQSTQGKKGQVRFFFHVLKWLSWTC